MILFSILVSSLNRSFVGVNRDPSLSLLCHLIEQPSEVECLFAAFFGFSFVLVHLVAAHHIELEEQVAQQCALARVDVAEYAHVVSELALLCFL